MENPEPMFYVTATEIDTGKAVYARRVESNEEIYSFLDEDNISPSLFPEAGKFNFQETKDILTDISVSALECNADPDNGRMWIENWKFERVQK
ncbi:hypothetical protein Ab1vBOLIVR5_gp145 [Agrobacterium phage OLIVR5]|uniref:Uncharacterized protein n=1 Tax=Agrobacterium phage OLIVR5 TaxID=2723773 RepID=A0A858MTE2_9CAUD|nr:hypothetical protein KNU99_gp256 [Agrobacterium phage OLIVR5]QIW87793.1 hypothetical protein Ab1vBOLIVR5_gp145 [Agrobacterium phage OLIVR5]QIW88058.1 hypothetical protein Ab1vBOLIVR6_gp151 [Agrobacterium phage OLIVR6]